VVAGVKGSLAAGIDLINETLLVSSLDEISTGYGLLADFRLIFPRSPIVGDAVRAGDDTPMLVDALLAFAPLAEDRGRSI
jgi:hypothetical protein